jgi:hypothetical protein
MGASVNHALGLSHLVAADREGLKQLVTNIANEKDSVAIEKSKVQRAREQHGWMTPKTTNRLLKNQGKDVDMLDAMKIVV